MLNFPKCCGHLDIFVSYSRKNIDEARPIAERLSLNNATVFFDETNIDEPNFDGQIRSAIAACDVFVVLLGRDYVDNSKSFARSEYEIAKEVKKLNAGKIVPVIVDSALDIAELDESLRALNIIKGPGELPVKVSNTVEKLRRIKPFCWMFAGVAAATVMTWLAWLILPPLPPVSLAVPRAIELKPVEAPPTELGKGAMDHPEWLEEDPILYTFNLDVQHLSDRGPTVRLRKSSASFEVANRTVYFEWHLLAEVCNDCVGAENWLGDKGPVTGDATTIQPGRHFFEEVIYLIQPYRSVGYQELIDLLLESSDEKLDVKITATVSYSVGFMSFDDELSVTCAVDIPAWQARVTSWMEEEKRYPFWSQLNCSNAL